MKNASRYPMGLVVFAVTFVLFQDPSAAESQKAISGPERPEGFTVQQSIDRQESIDQLIDALNKRILTAFTHPSDTSAHPFSYGFIVYSDSFRGAVQVTRRADGKIYAGEKAGANTNSASDAGYTIDLGTKTITYEGPAVPQSVVYKPSDPLYQDALIKVMDIFVKAFPQTYVPMSSGGASMTAALEKTRKDIVSAYEDISELDNGGAFKSNAYFFYTNPTITINANDNYSHTIYVQKKLSATSMNIYTLDVPTQAVSVVTVSSPGSSSTKILTKEANLVEWTQALREMGILLESIHSSGQVSGDTKQVIAFLHRKVASVLMAPSGDFSFFVGQIRSPYYLDIVIEKYGHTGRIIYGPFAKPSERVVYVIDFKKKEIVYGAGFNSTKITPASRAIWRAQVWHLKNYITDILKEFTISRSLDRNNLIQFLRQLYRL